MLGRNENALLQAAREHRDIKRLVRTVDTLPKLIGEALLKKYAADAPALYLVPGRFEVRDTGLVLTFTVAAVVRNVAGQAQARKGDGVDIGIDQLMLLATRALHEHRIGDATWFMRRGEMVDDEIFDAAGITALEMLFESSLIEMDADWALEDLDDFKTFHGDIDIAGGAGCAEHGKWLADPADFSSSNPDAQLDVQLPGAST
ncbi:hypothetical protein SAMN05216303_102292 [Rhodoferax sp. OV413]|uniref:hypothetical protein n=1 Tax=Rhodoferax sp. OV413 TaxID=1855285 RepID=UPI0008889B41|nr:hypothetical protein [Rhodoferax sp. OV413]SDO76321.1 hypothetical protein SAMN05216303_102292 [Rhodoferax sp. OV413]